MYMYNVSGEIIKMENSLIVTYVEIPSTGLTIQMKP